MAGTGSQKENVMADSTFYKSALSRAMALCSRREYCTADIRTKLLAWGAGENDTERILGTLIKENFLNEARYTEAFVKDKFTGNKWGKVKIAAHLKSKSIPGDLIRHALESIDDELYIRTLREIIHSHRKSVKAKNLFDLKGKLLRFGLSRGFESHLLYDLLNSTDE